jgi:TonB family protein
VAVNQQVQTQTVAVRSKATRPRYDLVQPQLKRPPLLPPLPKLNYVSLSIVAALALTAILFGPRLLRHRAPAAQTVSAETQSTPSVKSVPAVAHTKNASKPAAQKPAPPSVHSSSPSSQRAAQPPSQPSLGKSIDKHSLNTLPTAPAALTTIADTPRVQSVATSTSNPVTQGEVLEQILPDVSPKARATIRGTVHVAVKLRVDTSGNVASAELFSPGPSKYFADQALQAAHRWDFAPAKVDGHAVPSEWVVRFEFTPLNTKAHPTQSTP